MKPFVQKLLWMLGVPLSIALVLAVSGDEGILSAGLLLLFVVPAYLVIGVLLAIFSREGAEAGKAMVLAAGIIMMVGLSTCGLIIAGLH
ncbi:hypothetical protein HHL17_00500 [Chitinophaga sp. G-6-1-13]|uniref:Uncharacterized protein n=1 Tax=Chitinophaga fulva TaxID=2728842 RepID=A0A848GD93_9BACT|nr:hypothetical protein [Chitinophaga fulva]NML35661.1 hypothetical protein [Chitinophaga fulva]